MTRPRIAVLVSGSGTNLQKLIDAQRGGALQAEIALVVSNRPGAKGLERAKEAGIDALALDHRAYADRASFDHALDAALRERGVQLVVLAGFMRILTAEFVRDWAGRLVNIHPSLLPAFPGGRAIRDALEAGVDRTGVTVHFVDEGTDTGPIIAQEAVRIEPGDTEETLHARLQEVEHRLYPQVVDLLARGLVTLDQGVVRRNEPNA